MCELVSVQVGDFQVDESQTFGEYLPIDNEMRATESNRPYKIGGKIFIGYVG